MHRQGHSRWYVQAHSVPFANHTWLFFEARITHTCVQSTNQKLDLGKWLLQALKADLSHLGKRCWDPGYLGCGIKRQSTEYKWSGLLSPVGRGMAGIDS